MIKQAIVIGLGQFGMTVARELSEKNVEVLAVDVDEDRVRTAATFAASAVCFDATDERALSRAAPERRDVCLCAIGDEAKDASIICTALLRQLGAPRVVARANDATHGRILSLVGAHLVVNPELEFGTRFASSLCHQDIVGELSLGSDLMITEVKTPASMIGKNLAELDLRRRHGITVVAVRHGERGAVSLPDPAQALTEADLLVVVSSENAVASLLEHS